MKLVIINSYPINDCPGNELLDLLSFVLDFSEGKLFSSEFTSFSCVALHVDATALADGNYEQIPEPEEGVQEVQVIIVELTDAPNQVRKSLRLLALEATEGKPRT